MYVHRVILKGVPGIPDRDLSFFDDWTATPIKHVLFTGPNGTGKTTILTVIAWLWEKFSDYVMGVEGENRTFPPNLYQADLLAVELRDFLGQTLWLYKVNSPQQADRFVVDLGDEKAVFVGEVLNDNELPFVFSFKASESFQGTRVEIRALLEKLIFGVEVSHPTLPNMLFIPADLRLITSYAQNPEAKRHAQPEALFSWLVEYWFNDNPTLNLEGMLRNLKIRDPQWFSRTLADINIFLTQNGQQLRDFDNTLRLRVETTARKNWHYIETLSSGEQQCLLLIFMVSRWLMPGGIVLIDEPDLHLHGSWQRSLLHKLERLVAEKDGQLIVTSHSPLVIEEYREAQRFHLEGETQHS